MTKFSKTKIAVGLVGLVVGFAMIANTASAAYTFTTNLKQGSTGVDVMNLQKVLNSDPATQVSVSGAGAPGSETSYFGPATYAAVIKFQNKYASEVLTPVGLTSGTGFVGLMTRSKLNSMSGTVTGMVPGCTSTVGFSPTTGQSCATGSTMSTVTGCTSMVGFSPITGQKCDASTTITTVGGGISVSLSSDTPAGAAAIAGQATADLAHFTFTNTSTTEAKVTKVVLNRTGYSSDSTLSNVYLFSGAERLTDAASVSLGVITFNNTLGVFTIPAGSSRTISVQADIAASTAGQIVGVSLASVEANVPVSGLLPIAGNPQSIASASLGTVAFTYTGPSAATDNPANEVRVFEASTVVSTHKARLESVTFENRGTTKDGDLTNLKLFVDGVQVGNTVASFVNDRATFDLRSTPVSLDTGTRIIKVLADIVGGSSYTYNVQIRRASDVRVVDAELNQPILATTFAVAAGTANTIAGGTLSVTRAASSPSSNIAVGSTNVKLGTFEFRAAGEDIKIEAITVDTETSVHAGGLDNGKVFVNGTQIGSTLDIAEAGTEFTFGSSFVAKAGALTLVEIYADAKTSTSTSLSNAETVDVGVVIAAADTEGLSSGNTVTAVTEVEGNSITVSSSSLTATKASGYGDQTMIAGTNNAKLGSFVLSAGSTEGINVNTIVVELSSNESATITDLMLKDGSTGSQIGSTKPSPSTSNSFSVNLSIPASGTKTIDVYGNIKSGANAGPWIATIDTTTGGTGAITANSATIGSDLNLQTITVGSGTLTVAVNSGSTPNSYNAVAGTSDVKVGTFRFTSQYSPFTVQEMKVKIPADAATSVSSVTLKWTGGPAGGISQALALSSGAQTYATSTFTGLSFVVPQNENADLDVYVTIPTIASGASTGKAISALIDWDEGFKAVDAGGTSDTTAHASADLNSAATGGKGTVYVRKSIPTLASTPIIDALVAGSNIVIGKVTVTADSAGDIGWKKLSFTVNKTAAVTLGATTTLALWDSSNQVAGTFGTTTGDLVGGLDSLVNLTSGNLTFVATSEQEIAAGTSRSYELRTTVGGLAAGSNVSVSIANPSTSITTGTATSVAADTVASTPSFGWTDRSSISTVHSESTSDWTNDYLVKALPLTVGNRSVSF